MAFFTRRQNLFGLNFRILIVFMVKDVQIFCWDRPLSSVSASPYLHSIPASDPLTVEFAFDVRCDPQLCGVPEAIHFSGEVLSELGRVDHQQGFVVGVGS